MSKTRFVSGWIASSVVAVLLAVGVATAVLAQSLPFVLGVAAVEGLCLGVIQHVLLRRTAPALASRWAAATIAGALLGRACEFLVDTSRQASFVDSWSPIAQAAAVGTLGLAIGVLMAAPQALVLGRHIPGAWRWLAVRGGAWAIALMLLFASGSVLQTLSSAGPLVAIAAMVSIFAAVAAVTGALEGLGMAGMLRLGGRTGASHEPRGAAIRAAARS